eukprot:gene1998-3006_t
MPQTPRTNTTCIRVPTMHAAQTPPMSKVGPADERQADSGARKHKQEVQALLPRWAKPIWFLAHKNVWTAMLVRCQLDELSPQEVLDRITKSLEPFFSGWRQGQVIAGVTGFVAGFAFVVLTQPSPSLCRPAGILPMPMLGATPHASAHAPLYKCHHAPQSPGFVVNHWELSLAASERLFGFAMILAFAFALYSALMAASFLYQACPPCPEPPSPPRWLTGGAARDPAQPAVMGATVWMVHIAAGLHLSHCSAVQLASQRTGFTAPGPSSSPPALLSCCRCHAVGWAALGITVAAMVVSGSTLPMLTSITSHLQKNADIAGGPGAPIGTEVGD